MCVFSCCNSVEKISSYGSTVTEGRSVTVLCNNALSELQRDPDPAMYLLNHLHEVVETVTVDIAQFVSLMHKLERELCHCKSYVTN